MGAPPGNKNAAGPHGGASGHKVGAEKVGAKPASASQTVKFKPRAEHYTHAAHQKVVQQMNNQMRASRAEKIKNSRS